MISAKADLLRRHTRSKTFSVESTSESLQAAPTVVFVAGFWRRMVAGSIDLLLVGLLFGLLDLVVSLLLGRPLPRLAQLGPDYLLDVAANGDALAIAGLLLAAVLMFAYFLLFHSVLGQTPGKRLLHLRLIDGYGETPSLGRSIIRSLGYLPSLLLAFCGFLWIGFDREKRALHDWLADTYVIKGP